MYEEYWGLHILPFENVPDPRFLYRSSQHEEALMRLLYATKSQKGASMLTGEIGCGKTTLSRVFIQELSSDEYEIGLIANPCLSPIDFLKEILFQLGIEKSVDDKAGMLHALNDKMLENLNKRRKTMKRDYTMESLGYDDIYPSILKQQPSHFKSLLLGLCLRFMHLWHKMLHKKTQSGTDAITLN